MPSTFNLRIVLWVVFVATLFYNYQQWLRDYPPPAPVAQSATGTAGSLALDAAPPAVAPPASAPTLGTAVPDASPPSQASPLSQASLMPQASPVAGSVHVRTDVLDLEVSLAGGELSRADLLAYFEHKGDATPIRLLNRDTPESLFVLQSGLLSPTGAPAPTHQAAYTSPVPELRLADGQDELRLPLSWSDGQGLSVTKTYVFRRAQYAIGVEYHVANQRATPWSYAPYAQLLRNNIPVKSSYLHPDSYAFKGPAFYDGRKYQKLKIDKGTVTLDQQASGGWAAALQHHFVAAIVPGGTEAWHYQLKTQGNQYLLSSTGGAASLAPGASADLKSVLFVGPKLQQQLTAAGPELDRVADYGALTILARPLFKLLAFIHRLIGNWGFTIIIATLLLKLLFYPLSEASGRSMAKMKTLAPRIKQLQESYADQRDKLGKAMMELYQKEKVNPLAGCLPMVIQIPVFLAFYWVLLESVEMRQAPFVGWINDLSVRDPWFILPIIMAGAMFAQYKLNPTPPDPMQAKLFMIMPFAMSIMFAFFPAGLVLYWVTNTCLSILQQWNINRRISAAANK